MANNTLKVRHKQRYDTEENWKSKNPVLLAGEMAISSDKNGRFKVGDGNNKWSALAYAKADLSKSDVTTALGYTPPTTNTTYSTGTASTAGIGKLYTTTGTATDGSMTQSAITTALNGKSPTSHTHNYAGASSAGGSATSAVKLDTTTAGSATQPVYFTGGKPTACTYTLGCSVPSGAKFTDTNTWRGIQNNLTSNSTTDSLSAAQGKALKALVDGKSPSGHTHNYAGSASAGGAASNSLLLDGVALSSGTNLYNKVAYIGSDGVLEAGRYFDMHFSNQENYDFTTRLNLLNEYGTLVIRPRASTTCLSLDGVGNSSYIHFSGNGTSLGYIGLDNKDGSLIRYTSGNKSYKIHDTSSITYGAAAPTGAASVGDIYIQIS